MLIVTQRLVRDWTIESVKNLEKAIEHSADFEGWVLSFHIGGAYIKKVLYGADEIEYTGDWEITDKNRLRFYYTTTSGDVKEFYTILRLAEKQLRIKSTYEEIHYYAN